MYRMNTLILEYLNPRNIWVDLVFIRKLTTSAISQHGCFYAYINSKVQSTKEGHKNDPNQEVHLVSTHWGYL